MSPTGSDRLIPSLGSLFWETIDPLGIENYLFEVGVLEQAFDRYTPHSSSILPLCFLGYYDMNSPATLMYDMNQSAMPFQL